jgi:hypothetical protein
MRSARTKNFRRKAIVNPSLGWPLADIKNCVYEIIRNLESTAIRISKIWIFQVYDLIYKMMSFLAPAEISFKELLRRLKETHYLGETRRH